MLCGLLHCLGGWACQRSPTTPPLQTNLRNNNNKFYLIQLLEDNLAKQYSVWMRWGRGQRQGEGRGGEGMEGRGGEGGTFAYMFVYLQLVW